MGLRPTLLFLPTDRTTSHIQTRFYLYRPLAHLCRLASRHTSQNYDHSPLGHVTLIMTLSQLISYCVIRTQSTHRFPLQPLHPDFVCPCRRRKWRHTNLALALSSRSRTHSQSQPYLSLMMLAKTSSTLLETPSRNFFCNTTNMPRQPGISLNPNNFRHIRTSA